MVCLWFCVFNYEETKIENRIFCIKKKRQTNSGNANNFSLLRLFDFMVLK